MESAERMQQLLEPLKLYRWDGTYQWAELKSAGVALDACQAELEELAREMNLCSAEGYGLDAISGLLAHMPKAQSVEAMREALAALLRIQDGSFTLQAINDNLSGCGLVARAEELVPGESVRVIFPQIPGIPADFEEARPIIEDILPCHLEIDYHFWYITWRQLEEKLRSWRAIESRRLTWVQLEGFVS